MKKSKKSKLVASILSHLDIRRLRPYEIIWFIAISAMGLFLTILVPPFEKPDEHVHFYKAVSISQGIVHCQNPEQQYVYPNKFSELQSIMNKYGLTQNPWAKFYYKDYFQPVIDVAGQSGQPQSIGGQVCSFPSIAYLPQSLGLVFSNIFQIGGMYSFYVGRLFAFALFFTVLLAILVNTKQNGRIIFLAMASIPMLLHQVGSFSYDSVHITLSFIVGFLLFSFIEAEIIQTRQLIVFSILLILFFLVKGQAYVFFFLLPLLFIDKISIKIGKYLFSSKTIAILLAIIVILITLAFGSKVYSYMMDKPSTISPAYLQLQVLKEMPERLFEVVWDTTYRQFSFYSQSFIGNLGWLDYSVGHSLYLAIIVLLAVALTQFSFRSHQKYSIMKSIIIICILLGSYSVMLLGMYLFHTAYYVEIGGTLVEGVQGRYFLVFVPLIFVLFGFVKQSNFLKYFLACMLAIFMSYQLIYSVFHRYYDYASLYDLPSPAIDASNLDAAVLINDFYEQSFLLIPKKKYVGFSFHTDQKRATMPYWVLVYESSCDNKGELIGRSILSVQPNGFQKFVKINKFKPNGSNEICLQLKPVVEPQGDYMPILISTQSAVPISLYD